MAIDLAGIRNVGEFYSQHYLDSLFAGDVSELLAGWAQAEKDGGDKAPPKRLAALASRYFDALGLATGNGDGASASTRLGAARDLHAHLLEVLGYTREPAAAQLDDGSVLPLALQHQESGRPFLWVLEAPFAESEDDADPLSEGPAHSQLPTALRDLPEDQAPRLAPGSYRDLLDNVIFRGEHPPRWVLLLAGSDAFLIDRHKWHQGKYLHFELGTLFGRRDSKAMQAMAALLHSQVLLPRGGQSLLERLDEQSHKHAYAVSTDLKFGAQRAIELIANESVRYLREVAKQEVFGRDDVAEALTRECIVYLYRLLFLFYVEARSQETGVVPMGSDDYRRGYSLESLRDLELTPLTTVGAREGTYLDNSLRRLFRIVQHGYPRGYQHKLQEGDRDEDHIVDQMTVAPLRSALFDDEKTPILRRVKLRNSVLQEVLAQLSLSQPSGKGGQRGRISYAQLGINQLGAVYEGLLSYRGFFAYDNLFEVAAKTDLEKDGRLKPNAQTYFVPEAAAGDYSDNEFLKDEYGRRVAHQKGTYLFRLAGRDREKSASYYTPQVLTECLVKYTLLERLGESFGPADTRPASAAPAQAAGRQHLDAYPVRAGHGVRRVLERGHRPAGPPLPAGEASRARHDPARRAVPGRAPEGEVPLCREPELRRGPEPAGRRAGQGVGVAERAAPRGAGAVLGPAPARGQQPCRRAPRGVPQPPPHAEEHQRQPQLAGQRAHARASRHPAPQRQRLPLLGARRGHGGLRRRQGGERPRARRHEGHQGVEEGLHPALGRHGRAAPAAHQQPGGHALRAAPRAARGRAGPDAPGAAPVGAASVWCGGKQRGWPAAHAQGRAVMRGVRPPAE
ncbi:MAG: hypothetical protein IPG81_13885 [Sandaracinaceae bacterium]|nr:hypothetical protein [Sandaracinaceae bacterium]